MNANTLFGKPKIRVNDGCPKKSRWHISYVGQVRSAPCSSTQKRARVRECARACVRACKT